MIPSLLPLADVNLPLLHSMFSRSHGHHPIHHEWWDPASEVVLRNCLLSDPAVALVHCARTSDRDHHPDCAILVARVVIPLDRLLHELEHVITHALILGVDEVVAVGHDRDGQFVLSDVPVVTFFDYFVTDDASAFFFVAGVDFDLIIKVTPWTHKLFKIGVFENKNTFADHLINFICPCLSFHKVIFYI